MGLINSTPNEDQFLMARKSGDSLEQWTTSGLFYYSGAAVTTEVSDRTNYWHLERVEQDNQIFWSFYVRGFFWNKLYVTSEENGRLYLTPEATDSRYRLFEVLLRSDGGVFFRQRKFNDNQTRFLTTDNKGQLRMIPEVPDNQLGPDFEWFILKSFGAIEDLSRMSYSVEIYAHQESIKWINQGIAHSEIPVKQTSREHRWMVSPGPKWTFATGVYYAHQINIADQHLIQLDEVDDESREFPAEVRSEKYRFQSPIDTDLYVSHVSEYVDLSGLSNATWWETPVYRISYLEDDVVRFYPPLIERD